MLNASTRSFLKKNKSDRVSISYRKAATFGILFSVEDRFKHEAIKDFVRVLEHDGKKVSVISYLPEKKENFEFLFNFFTEKDISFWGNLRSHDALTFTEMPFDYLYCFDLQPNPYVLNLLARSHAKCRIGKHWNQLEPYFELMITNVTNTKGLIDQAFKYTKDLK